MKKFALLMAIVCMVGVFSMGALAKEATVYYTDNPCTKVDDARVFLYGEAEGECNKPQWDVTINTIAHVAQWVEFEFDNTTWEWYIRKPGDYFADCMKFYIRSNGDVVVTFNGFADLLHENGSNTLETYYYATTGNLPEAWVAAGELDSYTLLTNDVIGGIEYTLWNRIVVEESSIVCSYKNSGIITITLDNQKDWIDTEGDWDI